MENIARAFDCPVDSPEHASLAETACMGGCLVTVRYYLGRLLGRNLFRETDAEVENRLVEYVSQTTSAAGGKLIRGGQGWDIASEILRHRFEMQMQGSSNLNLRNIAAVEAFLGNPSVRLDELASKLGTTEKQLARNATLTLVRRQAQLTLDGRQ
jgi:hypothetical protein